MRHKAYKAALFSWESHLLLCDIPRKSPSRDRFPPILAILTHIEAVASHHPICLAILAWKIAKPAHRILSAKGDHHLMRGYRRPCAPRSMPKRLDPTVN